jgi:uroporphyrinogen III methyltransferase/synthase
VLQFPTIEIAPPASWDSLDRVIEGRYDWIVFTSSNGVASYFDRLMEKKLDARALAGVKIAAVGASTAADLRARGINPDLVPEKFLSTALLPLLAADQTGVRTAVIRAEEGREELIDELRRRGGTVDLGVAYRTVAADFDLDELRTMIAEKKVDVVTFTSGSTVDHFYGKLTPEERSAVNAQAILASMGPTTSEALRRYGKEPDVVAENATIDALRDAVIAAVSREAATV